MVLAPHPVSWEDRTSDHDSTLAMDLLPLSMDGVARRGSTSCNSKAGKPASGAHPPLGAGIDTVLYIRYQ